MNKSTNLNLLYRVIILFQILSLIYSFTTGFLSGDYISYEFKNNFNLILGFLFCSLPFYLIKIHLSKKNVLDNNVLSLNEIYSFKYVVAILLIVNILFSFFFNVGKSASDIYDAPILLKPVIVVVNRININIVDIPLFYLFYPFSIQEAFVAIVLSDRSIITISIRCSALI